jgi:hypothetical protein
MKTFRRFSSIAVFVMIGVLGICATAQAYISGDHEYIVGFRPGISWEEAKAEVAGWGEDYHLVTITSRAEYKYVKSLLQGLSGEFLIGGYRDGGNHWNWVTGEAWGFSPGLKKKMPKSKFPWDRRRYLGTERTGGNPGHHAPGYMWDYLAMSNINSEDAWRWYSEGNPRRITGFIAERTLSDASPVPVPSAALLLGSGLSVLGGLRMARRKAGVPKESSRPTICR